MVSSLSNVSLNCTTLRSQKSVGFSAQKDSEYKNPVSPTMERVVACTGPTVLSLILGTAAGFAVKHAFEFKNKKWPLIIGTGVAVVSGLMSIPGAWYGANVNTPLKKGEFSVKDAELKAETNIARGINEESKDPGNLDESLNHFYKLNMAKKGGVNVNTSSI